MSETLHNPQIGHIFASTEKVKGNKKVYSLQRCKNRVMPSFSYDRKVWLDYSVENVFASTQKMLLSKDSTFSIVGHIAEITEDIVIHPLIMGPPILDHLFNKDLPMPFHFLGFEYFQIFPKDIDEFNGLSAIEVETPEEWLFTQNR